MEPQSKFTNVSGGVTGAIKLNHKGEPHGIALTPGESVWLTEQEEVLTANAPRNPEDNPFTNGTFRLDVRAADAADARPIGSRQEVQPPPPERPPEAGEGDHEGIDLRVETTAPNDPPPQPTGQPAPPVGEPVVGQRQVTEEAAVVEETPAVAPVDPAAEEPAVPPAPPKPAAAPEPKPGQSKRAARVDPGDPAVPKPKPAAAPAPAPAPTPAE